MLPVYLSRLRLNLHRREIQQDLADCQALHKRVLSAFPQVPGGSGNARDHFNILYRLETQHDQAVLLVQSAVAPVWDWLSPGLMLAQPEVKRIEGSFDRLVDGMALRFRLVANPTRRISGGNPRETEQWHGKRVAIVGEAQQMAWLAHKGEASGFTLLPVQLAAVSNVRVMPQALANGQRRGNQRVTLSSVRFDGRLRITDAEQFRHTLAHGIGSGKAFGMGLLSIAPDTPRF